LGKQNPGPVGDQTDAGKPVGLIGSPRDGAYFDPQLPEVFGPSRLVFPLETQDGGVMAAGEFGAELQYGGAATVADLRVR
jgi:hypothetical protein